LSFCHITQTSTVQWDTVGGGAGKPRVCEGYQPTATCVIFTDLNLRLFGDLVSDGGRGTDTREIFPILLRSPLLQVLPNIPDGQGAAAGATWEAGVLGQFHLSVTALGHIQTGYLYILPCLHWLPLLNLFSPHVVFICNHGSKVRQNGRETLPNRHYRSPTHRDPGIHVRASKIVDVPDGRLNMEVLCDGSCGPVWCCS